MGPVRAALAVALAMLVHRPCDAASPRLAGIVIAGAERVAIFAGEPGTVMFVARVGDVIGNERVAAIDAAGVRLDGPAATRLLTVEHDRLTRAALAPVIVSPPLLDPYRRERETENDQ